MQIRSISTAISWCWQTSTVLLYGKLLKKVNLPYWECILTGSYGTGCPHTYIHICIKAYDLLITHALICLWACPTRLMPITFSVSKLVHFWVKDPTPELIMFLHYWLKLYVYQIFTAANLTTNNEEELPKC